MDRVPHFQKLVQGVKNPRGIWLSRKVVLERDRPKTAQKGNKSPGVEWKVPEKVPERLPSVRPNQGAAMTAKFGVSSRSSSHGDESAVGR